MAGEKKMESGMCGSCFMMDKMCSVISGLLVVVSGASMILAAMGSLPATTAMLVGGATLALFGVGFLVHGLKMCPMCK